MNLSDIKNWVFDLDNTLYSPEEDIFSQIDKRMTEFIVSKFNVNEEEAFNIQKKYFLEYGTTLSGLMKRENIDPDEFLEFVHDINLEILKPNINAYLNFIDKTKIEPDISIMFEDIGRNLEAAKKLGMKTVLIKRNVPMRNDKLKTKDFESLWEENDFADCITDDLVKFFNNYYI